MTTKPTKYPFEATAAEIAARPDSFVDAVFSCLTSEFLTMPRGDGFVPFPVFETGYEALKQGTKGFSAINEQPVYDIIKTCPIAFVVLRAMLGFTPPEWAYITTQATKCEITQGFIRSLDRKIRSQPLEPIRPSADIANRIQKLVATACKLLKDGAPVVPADRLHRLDKADTQAGLSGMKALAKIGAPYAMVLYERFLGRPFAGHRDSVSELIGDGLENAIEDVLSKAGISFRKTKRAEKISGFDQAPDFIIPSEFNPQVIIEAKITEDDGTARDKVTRIQHLAELSGSAGRGGKTAYEVIACIGGRGFGVRREDMKKMLLATKGKIFTVNTLDRLVQCTKLKNYKSI
ncbi:MAG: hypothetical protein PHI39_04160 [Kiritimatiellae bacterium]|nr:hypothetical protein [Kiritimatiellia bacterium]